MLLVMLIILLIIIASFIGIYNILVVAKNQVKNAWSQIDVQLKRRYDLIPNLVNTASGYMKFEKSVLENITKARSACMSINESDVASKAKAENMLTSTLKSLFAVVENYPDLKANKNMLALQEELTNTENKISFARQYYNDRVMIYNTKIETIPINLIASIFNFTKVEFFEVETPEEKKPVKVEFNT